MPGRPSRRVTRKQYWWRKFRAERSLRGRFIVAAGYYAAMTAAGERSIPQATARMVTKVTHDLMAAADELGARIPREELERTGPR